MTKGRRNNLIEKLLKKVLTSENLSVIIVTVPRWCGSMAEQLICNQQVDGSTPFTSSSLYGGIPERPKGADCKSVVTDFAGPNPASPTKIRKLLLSDFFFCNCFSPFLYTSTNASSSFLISVSYSWRKNEKILPSLSRNHQRLQ